MADYPNSFFLTTSNEQGVLHVRFNRPKVLNAVHRPAYLEFGAIFRKAGQDPKVRAIVSNGEGRALTAGLDVASMAGDFVNDDAEASRKAIKLSATIREFQDACAQPYYIEKPVICVAHGPAIGLAIDIMTACDLRFASEDTKFSVREIQIGMAADIGTLQRSPRLVNNLGWVKDVCFTGRDFNAAEAQAQGSVQRVYKTKDEAVQAALDLAAELAEKSPVAMLGTKRSINYALEHSHKESSDQIAEFNAYALGGDFIEGCMAMSQATQMKKKVKPVYAHL